MPAPPITQTIQQILDTLNGTQLDRPWIAIDGYYAINQTNIVNGVVNFNQNSGIILKAFFNKNTGEIKTYIAKYLDIPERESLF